MTAFMADLALLEELIDRAARFELVLAEELDQIDARVRRVRSAWDGSAADEYGQAHAAWLAGAGEMRAALATLRRLVTTAHGNYAEAVSANRAMWP